MYRILGSFILFLTFLSAGKVTATVDSREVLQGDTVLLTLSVTGKNIDTVPQIDEISGYPVFNTQRRSATNFVHTNGVSRMEKTQILIMEFRPDANMTIPSFSVKVDGKMESSNAIDIKVLKSATGMKRETQDFSLDISVDKEKFYLGESIVLNLYFKQRNNIDVMQIDYSPPAFKEFFSKQIGEGKTYKKGDFTIQELNYLLIAKKTGILTLEPARAKIAKRARQRQMGWFVDVPEWSQVSSDTLSVEVIEPNVAHDIVGKYRLTDTVDVTKVKANKPVTLKIELLGMGSLEDYEGINFDIPDVTMYSDDAKVESKLLGKELQSRYQKSFVFIADQSFTIPSKEIRVYNYETGQVTVLKTKAYNIEVTGSKKAVNTSTVHTKTPVQTAQVLNPDTRKWHDKLPSVTALVLAFLLGVLTTLVVNYLRKLDAFKWKRKTKSFKYDEALKVLYPKMSESKEVEEMVRQLYAIKNGDKDVKIDKNALKALVEKYQ
jgi:hypothetical protein